MRPSQPASVQTDTLIAALDVGCSKVTCLIGRVTAEGMVRVLGVGHRMCRGLRDGLVVDPERTERAIRAVVDQAERVAGQTITSVLVSVDMAQIRSDIIEVSLSPRDRQVTTSGVHQLQAEAWRAVNPGDMTVLHAYPAAYGLDGAFMVKPPLGLYGDTLSLALHVVMAPATALQNLVACIRAAHLDVAGFVAAGYASGHAALVSDEKELGAACIDIGASLTTLGVWTNSRLVYLETLPFGGARLTDHLAAQLQTPLDAAERLKTLHGCALDDLCADHETVQIPAIDDPSKPTTPVPRRLLAEALSPPMTALFQEIGRRLNAAGLDQDSAGRVVLTGGCADLEGIAHLAQRVLKRTVRTARPRRVMDLASSAQKPAFSTAAGLLLHGVEAPTEVFQTAPSAHLPGRMRESTLTTISRWLIDHF